VHDSAVGYDSDRVEPPRHDRNRILQPLQNQARAFSSEFVLLPALTQPGFAGSRKILPCTKMDEKLTLKASPVEPELELLRRQLKLGEQLLAAFRQAMGHDMPNHLVAAQGLVRLLEMDEKERLSPAGKEYLGRLTIVLQRVEALTRMLAEICRVGRDEQPAERVSIAEVAQEVSVEMNQLFPGRLVAYHLPTTPFFLDAARPDVRRLLSQLMRNALQASPESTIAHVELGTSEAAGKREFWIADRGRGLLPDARELIQSYLSGRAVKSPGTGLGLLLVRRIVVHWGGTIRVDSEPGRGTIFTVSLSAAREAGRP
jgi:signal transduction histidine kinase